ncbi:DNA repair and recombination protein RAD54 [Hypsizygus marmoreus]|uniref:DNA repair and recombination protein RAD54 n=1 Tax=Hypsizygus marmoreus TaxID=39966 RepID=A0A369K7I6_HYPMA|nr:DNA repair and recombination protein RAD54 [Hypsizygus marmoreus]
MPTLSIASALLAMSGPDNYEPWTWNTWVTLTSTSMPPFHPDVKPNKTLTSNVLSAIRAYAAAFWAKDSNDRVSFGTSKKDNNAEGRNAWNTWAAEGWKSWKGNNMIDAILVKRGASPHALIKFSPTRQLPDLHHAGAWRLYPEVAEQLFGDEAFVNVDSPFQLLRPNVNEFISALFVKIWDRYRRTLTREVTKLTTLQDETERLWTELTADGATPDKKAIRHYITKLNALMKLLHLYGDIKAADELKINLERMKGMLSAMGREGAGDQTKVPKALRDALAKLATELEIAALTAEILQGIRDVEDEEDFDVPEVGDGADPGAWKEGTEEYNGLSTDELWTMLGRSKEKTIPFFNDFLDPTAIHTPWTDEGKKFFADKTKAKTSLSPRWHQIVGIVKMLELGFSGQPVLLMDEVGLGKTMQTIGVIAMLAWFSQYYGEHKDYPGRFKGRKWPSDDGKIPRLDSIIVVPVPLLNQMIGECRRYLQPNSFDIFPYTGLLDSHAAFWSTEKRGAGVGSSKQPIGRRLIVATMTAMTDDGSRIYALTSKDHPSGPLRPIANAEKLFPKTIFGREWLVAALDEAHNCRNLTFKHLSARALREKTELMIGMTATPVTTRPEDLLNLGLVLGVNKCCDDEADALRKTINTELRSANTADRKARATEVDDEIVRGVLQGKTRPERWSNYKDAMISQIADFREAYDKVVIRRTGDSVDNMGKPIIGLPPFDDRALLLDLYPSEYEYLDKVAEELVDNSAAGTKFAMGRTFYSRFRRVLTHPACDGTDRQWHDPQTQAEWKTDPSRKIDALVEILRHHLKEDGAPPLKVDENNNIIPEEPVPPVPEEPVPPAPDQPVPPAPEAPVPPASNPPRDKIVVYSYWPSSNSVLLQVLKLYGITDIVECNGNMSPAARNKALEQFNDPNGPRVLLLSSVGMTGLNLQIANIMIINDTLWSAQEDRQLIGRIWRQPQGKQVIIYRLIAKKTADVFLNNISFDKSVMHNSFTGATPNMKRAFGDDSSEGSDEEDEDPPPAPKVPKGKSAKASSIKAAAIKEKKEKAKKPTTTKKTTTSKASTSKKISSPEMIDSDDADMNLPTPSRTSVPPIPVVEPPLAPAPKPALPVPVNPVPALPVPVTPVPTLPVPALPVPIPSSPFHPQPQDQRSNNDIDPEQQPGADQQSNAGTEKEFMEMLINDMSLGDPPLPRPTSKAPSTKSPSSRRQASPPPLDSDSGDGSPMDLGTPPPAKEPKPKTKAKAKAKAKAKGNGKGKAKAKAKAKASDSSSDEEVQPRPKPRPKRKTRADAASMDVDEPSEHSNPDPFESPLSSADEGTSNAAKRAAEPGISPKRKKSKPILTSPQDDELDKLSDDAAASKLAPAKKERPRKDPKPRGGAGKGRGRGRGRGRPPN